MIPKTKLPRIVLASESPRRRQLLESLGIQFELQRPDAEEILPSPQEIRRGVCSNAEAKAASVAKNIQDPHAIVVGADTLVMVDNRILGKPRDSRDAAEMLRLQSGKTQSVFTGLALCSEQLGSRNAVEETKVTFKQLSSAQIENYLETAEPYDKAAAYAVQGLGALFIEKIEGSYTNVMGFPLELFLTELSLLAKIPVFDWFKK